MFEPIWDSAMEAQMRRVDAVMERVFGPPADPLGHAGGDFLRLRPLNRHDPILRMTIVLHGARLDHDDPPSGLARDCESCGELARKLYRIAQGGGE